MISKKIMEDLRHGDPLIRAQTVKALGDMDNPVAVDLLIESLKDPVAMVRKKAIKSLGNYGFPDAIEPLIHLLQDPDLKVQERAKKTILSFERFGKNQLMIILLNLHEGKEEATQASIVELLDSLESESAAPSSESESTVPGADNHPVKPSSNQTWLGRGLMFLLGCLVYRFFHEPNLFLGAIIIVLLLLWIRTWSSRD